MKSLIIAALVVILAVFVLTLPLFFLVRGTDIEIPFAVIVVCLGIIGVLSAQLTFIRKGKEKNSRVLSVAVLVQILLLLVLVIFMFINVEPGYYWYPATTLVLALALLAIISAKIALDKRRKKGSLV